jgi:hypothetical protein
MVLSNMSLSPQLSLEKEEQERQELRKLIMGGSSGTQDSQDGRNADGKRRMAHKTKDGMAGSAPAGAEDDSSMQGLSSQPGL